MKLVNQSAEPLIQLEGIGGLEKKIELAGRTCYKSEDKITEESASKFVERLKNNGHTAMLEHGTVYLTIPLGSPTEDINYTTIFGIINYFQNNPYSVVKDEYKLVPVATIRNREVKTQIHIYNITTNYRVINDILENKIYEWDEIMTWRVDTPTVHEKRFSFKITTSISVARELCRHRKFSFAQESTRYCNYTKDKFDNGLTFIIPYWTTLNSGPYDLIQDEDGNVLLEGDGYLVDTAEMSAENLYLISCYSAEASYKSGIKEFNLNPQSIREVLPLGLKTELIMTGFESDWRQFFDLRYYEKTGPVHPDMKVLATIMHDQLYGDTNN